MKRKFILILILTLFIGVNISIAQSNDPDQCYDLSTHTASFITTEPGVSLEVLDWGGTGDYVVLLTGLGDNAHVFDNFAYQFTDKYHVIGITRRGFGLSSKPKTGYDEATRVRDYISILDQLNISKAYFVGHSIACGELNVLGINYPDRVKKLVYLDGLDYGEQKTYPQPPGADFSDADMSSVDKAIAVLTRYYGFREPNAAFCGIYYTDSTGTVVDQISPPEVTAQIVETSKTVDFSLISVPVFGLFEEWTPDTRLPYYWYLSPDKKAEYDVAWKTLYDWRARRMERFTKDIKNCRTLVYAHVYHYIFINREADVSREVRNFLAE